MGGKEREWRQEKAARGRGRHARRMRLTALHACPFSLSLLLSLSSSYSRPLHADPVQDRGHAKPDVMSPDP